MVDIMNNKIKDLETKYDNYVYMLIFVIIAVIYYANSKIQQTVMKLKKVK